MLLYKDIIDIQLSVIRDIMANSPEETLKKFVDYANRITAIHEKYNTLDAKQRENLEKEYQRNLLEQQAMYLSVALNKHYEA